MANEIDWVDGWEIRPREDGGFGVYDAHGMVEGPFGTRDEAMSRALKLPRPVGESAIKPKDKPAA